MIRTLISLLLAVSAIASTTACSPISTAQGKGAESNDDTNTPNDTVIPPPVVADGTESYFKISSTGGYVTRSSSLKFEGGMCYLANLYDFPDDLFGDDSLDNLTTTSLALNSCRRLALAEAIRTATGSCAPSSVILSASEKAQIGIDPAKLGLTGVSASQLQDTVTTLELSADCVCSVQAVTPVGGLSTSLSLPPALTLCTQKFAAYSAANLSSAAAQISAAYGIQ